MDLERFHARGAKTSYSESAQQPASRQPESKITIFNAGRVARELDAENARLQDLIDRHGIREVAEIEAQVAGLRKILEEEQQNLHALHVQAASAQQAIHSAKAELLDLRNAQEVQELGLYDFEHPAESSVSLSTELESVRSQIKSMVRSREATTAISGFTFNNSTSKGTKFVKDMSSVLLRAYNAEAENCIKTVRAGNLGTAQTRLSKVKDQIARQGSMIGLRIVERYHALRLRELELAARHLQAVKAEKDMERERRAELAEQRRAEQELRRELERLEKERSHYAAALAALEAKGDTDGAQRMRDKLEEVGRAIDDVDYRVANIRAGYVYVISNLGAFGPDIVKIGMTRRLEPMDRVNELGDASVPFRFDVHALFFAHDAVGIEAMLHQTFAEQRVNRVNMRREFFRVTPQQVLDVLKQHSVEVLEFTVDASAPEFRLSSTKVSSTQDS